MEAPFVTEGIVQVAAAIVLGELIEPLHASMPFEIVVRAAQHVPPRDETADDQARVRRRDHAQGNVVALLDEIDLASPMRRSALRLR